MEDLERFIKAQEGVYSIALEEINNGKKRSHWIWFVFPQLQGLGHSYRSNFYGIKDSIEAKKYLDHPILAKRLREITKALLSLPNNLTAKEILGNIDARKVQSSMTLFYYVSQDPIFAEVLNRFYNGDIDYITWYKLNKKLEIIRQYYIENKDDCNSIIESLGYYDATRTMSPEEIPFTFKLDNDWCLLDGFDIHKGKLVAYICDLTTGPPDCGTIDAIAIPDSLLDKVITVISKKKYGKVLKRKT